VARHSREKGSPCFQVTTNRKPLRQWSLQFLQRERTAADRMHRKSRATLCVCVCTCAREKMTSMIVQKKVKEEGHVAQC
jgi:hypothetical protein